MHPNVPSFARNGACFQAESGQVRLAQPFLGFCKPPAFKRGFLTYINAVIRAYYAKWLEDGFVQGSQEFHVVACLGHVL